MGLTIEQAGHRNLVFRQPNNKKRKINALGARKKEKKAFTQARDAHVSFINPHRYRHLKLKRQDPDPGHRQFILVVKTEVFCI